MTNINKQSQSLHEIAGVEDLGYENAAACSGGSATLYDRVDFKGTSITFPTGNKKDLDFFNNRTESIEITSGTWRFWTGQNYTGESITLSEGKYNVRGIFKNNIESFSRLV